MRTWRAEKDANGVLHVTIDKPEASVNAFSASVLDDLEQLLGEIERDASSIKGVLFKSGKPGNFIAGADIKEMTSITSKEQAKATAERGQKLFARLERLPVTTIALISGSCLGGGLEFAMACKYRIADEDRKTVLGLPEVRLGLVPGWGGTVRLPRLVGTPTGVQMILAGQMINGLKAKSRGLVHDVVPTEALTQAGLVFLKKGPPKPKKQPLKAKVMETKLVRNVILKTAEKQMLAMTHGHYPGPKRVIEVLRAGLINGPEAGFKAEAEAIGDLSRDPVTVECIRLFFLNDESKKWAEEVAPSYKSKKISHVGLLGAGTMGASLAKIMADKGIMVRLKDVKAEYLAKGLKVAYNLFSKDAKKKKVTQREADRGFSRISPATDYSGLKNADLVIEAVLEDLKIKREVFQELEKACGPDTILATNTSSLRLADIVTAVQRPERFVGIHFFNPPHKMQLVEVVTLDSTGEDAIATALALVSKLGKTPVVVKDCPGFLVNRLLTPYMNEAGYLLAEVDDPMEVERAAIEFGFPMGPLELMDLVGAGVAAKVSQVLYEAYGDRMAPAPAWKRLTELQKSMGAAGAATKVIQGKGSKKQINPQVAKVIAEVRRERQAQAGPGRTEKLSHTEIAERLVFPVINEAARALDEGIVRYPEEVDMSMVFGTGFAPFRGGPLRYADSIGVGYVVETLERLAAQNPRLAPSDALRARAAEGGRVFESALKVPV
ncbi:enoyl-CoA hydratase/isomerase family protein [bacterium]|nr:enoyl-CoA hydratase/isomerase family protein [bacterium]